MTLIVWKHQTKSDEFILLIKMDFSLISPEMILIIDICNGKRKIFSKHKEKGEVWKNIFILIIYMTQLRWIEKAFHLIELMKTKIIHLNLELTKVTIINVSSSNDVTMFSEDDQFFFLLLDIDLSIYDYTVHIWYFIRFQREIFSPMITFLSLLLTTTKNTDLN